MIKIVLGILLCYLFIGCKSYDNSIETIYYFEHGQNGFDTIVPKRFEPYLTKKQVEEFKHHGFKRFEKNPMKVFYSIYYVWINDSVFNGRRLKDTAVKWLEQYVYTDGAVGRFVEYYPNGKVSFESNYALINDSTKKTISLEEYSKLSVDDKLRYSVLPDSSWKSYSPDGKLIKEEIYNKGTLVR